VRSVALVGGGDAITEALARRLNESGEVETGEATRCEVLTGSEVSAERLNEGGFDTLVYVAGARSPDALPDLDDARKLFAACAAARVPHLTVLSSAAVHEPSHHHPGVVSEDRLAPLRHGNRVAARWRELEELAAEAVGKGDETVLTVLRPVTTPVPGAPGNRLARVLTARLALTLPGHDPSVQLLSLDDLVAAVIRAVEDGRGGTWHVAPERPVPLRKALRLGGVRRLPVPRWLQRLTVPADELAYLRYPWTVSGERMRQELGFVSRRSSAETARALSGALSGSSDSSGVPAARPPLPDFDEWGLDVDYIAAFERTLFRFLHDIYWRIELTGLEHLPREGAAVLTGIHRGFQPWDGVMAVVAVRRATGRTPRFLLHPTLVKMPFLANYMTKLGGIHACRENADRILDLLGIFPEGIRGAFSYYRDAYELKRFGRDEFVKMALRNRAPIVPFVTVGSAEIYPIFGKFHWRWWKRWAEWPCFPITPNLGTIPLPSKWHTRFLPPVHVEEEHGPEAADDPEVVRALSLRIQQTMKAALDEILTARPSIFWGSVFEEPEGDSTTARS
jgi:1-acyl-sn-glycerol-3-phosphate acyltransferase/nucleoside-diphosphate-sugar epimerase